MKQAVILHGTGATPQSNWFPWLKKELESRDFEVWVPQLPGADTPDAYKWTKFLLESDWDFQDTMLIGHSAGAVEILQLLEHLEPGITVSGAVLAGAFTDAILADPDWHKLSKLFEEPVDFVTIETKLAKPPLFVHGDDDPYCDPVNAKWLAGQLHGAYVEIPGGKHLSMSMDPTFKEFPQLIEAMEQTGLL